MIGSDRILRGLLAASMALSLEAAHAYAQGTEALFEMVKGTVGIR